MPVEQQNGSGSVLDPGDDVVAMYREPRASSDKTLEFKPKFGDSPLYEHHTTSLVFNDPPLHTRVRRLIAGALTPAGLGGCVIEMMERGLVDFVISTGANLYHDLHYALNFTLHRGSPFVDDVELYEDGVIRIYDVLFPATVLLETDAYIRDFLAAKQAWDPRGIFQSDWYRHLCGLIA